MRAHYLSVKERNAARNAAHKIIEEELEDVAKRAQYLWMAAMLNAGLAASTIKRVQKELAHVTEEYGKGKQDGLADYELITALRNHGIEVEDTKTEM